MWLIFDEMIGNLFRYVWFGNGKGKKEKQKKERIRKQTKIKALSVTKECHRNERKKERM